MKTETFVTMNYHEFDEYVNQTYGFPRRTFEFCADQEASNDSSHSFDLTDSKPFDMSNVIDVYDREQLDEFISSKGKKGSFLTHIILRDLILLGVLPKGKYLIEVSW